MKYIYILLCLLPFFSYSQQDGVLIGEKPSGLPDATAELEVYSTHKGVLLPRVSDNADIADPAPGLLVFNTTSNMYNYYDGTDWISLPASSFYQLRDADEDTKVLTEEILGSNENKILLDVSGVRKLVVDNTGVSIDAGSTYKINGTTVADIDGASVFIGDGAGTTLASDANNVLAGTNAGNSLSTGASNVVAGYGAGSASDYSSSVLLGASSGINNAADNNTLIGANAGALVSSGAGNVFIGTDAGSTVTTGGNNTLIGVNAGNGLQTGSNNTVIGAGVTLSAGASDSVKIGEIIAANKSTGQVTFNKEYSFPTVADGTVGGGKSGETIVLDTDDKTLIWEDAGVSAVDQTVIGSAAGLYTFDIGSKDGYMLLQNNMIFIPLVAGANASIQNIMTWIKERSSGNLEMALFDDSGLLIEQQTVPYNFVYIHGFIRMELTTPYDVVSGQKYWIGLRDTNNELNLATDSNVSGSVKYYDKGNSYNHTDNRYDTFPNNFRTNIPAGYTLENEGQKPWVRVF